MASEGQQPDEMKELERELRALVPRGPKVDLARIMYRAGQASMSPIPAVAPVAAKVWGGWFWPTSAGVMTLLALWLGVMLIVSQVRPAIDTRDTHNHTAVVQPALPKTPAPNSPMLLENVPGSVVESTSPGDARYLRDRQVVISQGADALPHNQAAHSQAGSPPGSAPPGTPGSYGSLSRGLLREHRRTTQRATMWSELWNQ
jgi:hypothetical protein